MVYVLFWCVFAYVTIARRGALLAMLFCAMSFGAFSVLPPEVTGGLTLLPRLICALAVIATALAQPGGARRAWSAMVSPGKLGLLSAFLLAAWFASLFMPHIFAGRVPVIGLNTAAPELLRPSGLLPPQAIYLTMSYCVALAVCLSTEQPGGRSTLANAVAAGALTAAVAGLLDIATHGTGLLDPLRSASYRMLTTGEILGASRVVGFMSEASSYGGLTAGLGAAAYFLARAIDPGTMWGKVARVAPFAALGLAALSTSSTAFLALGMFLVVATLDWVLRAARDRRPEDRSALFRQLVTVAILALAIGVTAVVRPALFHPVTTMLDRMVFHKADSASYVERSMWNRVALHALLVTHGLGVGLGATRTSSLAGGPRELYRHRRHAADGGFPLALPDRLDGARGRWQVALWRQAQLAGGVRSRSGGEPRRRFRRAQRGALRHDGGGAGHVGKGFDRSGPSRRAEPQR